MRNNDMTAVSRQKSEQPFHSHFDFFVLTEKVDVLRTLSICLRSGQRASFDTRVRAPAFREDKGYKGNSHRNVHVVLTCFCGVVSFHTNDFMTDS